MLIRTINRFGGFPVGVASLLVESFGVLLLWRASSPWMAFTGAIFTGLGFSLVFPALGVEALARVTENNRGSALGIFTAFADVSFFLVGPVAGIVIGAFGYASAFLFALLCVLAAMGIVVVLMRMRRREVQDRG
jgi:predicted MFS family arabinose efflux permease